MWEVRSPQGYSAVLMAKMYDRVMLVLGHGGTRSELRAVLRNKLTCRYVLIFQIARVSLPMGLSRKRVLVYGKVHTTVARSQ